jgi:polyhydroxybutyrate depolymerase
MMNKIIFTGMVASLLIGFGSVLTADCFAEEAAMDTGQMTKREWFKLLRQEHHANADPNAAITKPGDYTFSITYGGLVRWYRVHVPASYSPSSPTPLVFAFHGGGGGMDIQANDTYYGQISKSEQAGYIVVFPNGFSRFKSGMLATWNAGNCCAQALDNDIDDVGFVREIIKHLSVQLNVDAKRIFANGMSNGGMMAYRLACEMPDVFKAIASVAGTDNTKACSPKVPISILHIHARNDDTELFDGGSGRKLSRAYDFVSVPDSIAKWVKLNGCNAMPKRVLENAGAYCDVYAQCRGGVEIKLCVTADGGHSWPGGKKPRGDAPSSSALSAADVIWDFFNTR